MDEFYEWVVKQKAKLGLIQKGKMYLAGKSDAYNEILLELERREMV